MPSMTLTLPEEQKSEIDRFSWVTWSEVARLELLQGMEENLELERIRSILKKSRMTESMAIRLGREAKEETYRRSTGR